MTKASIIIPIYNVEKYVHKCIESVINQTEKDIEILLVDDGSTDSSGKICDDYARADQRIRVLHKENGGLSSARNYGTEHATSEYVQFLDGDDFLRPDTVEVLYKTMQLYPCDFVQFMYQEVSEIQEPDVKEQSREVYQAKTSKELFENLYRLGGVAASGATKFMRRELALKIPFENIRHEDEMWCTRAFQDNLTVTYITDELYYYVMREGSIIHSKFNRKKLDRFIISEERLATLHKNKLYDFCGIEYGKMFFIIVDLYSEAHASHDKASLEIIRGKFFEHKTQMYKYGMMQTKFRLLLKLMMKNYGAIKIYLLYRRLRNKTL